MIPRKSFTRFVRFVLTSALVVMGWLGAFAPLPAHVEAMDAVHSPTEPVARAPRAPAVDTYWSTETVDSGADIGQFSSLAIDSTDHLHVSYYDANDTALRYATSDGSTWITATVDNTGSVGQYASLDLDDGDLLHISYYDASNTALKYAHWNGSWSHETVDNSASVGEYSSLGIGTTFDDVLISYYDASNQSLKVARLYRSLWTSATVDAGPGVGRGTALDTARYPHIVYYDANDNNLQYVEDTSFGWDFSDSPVNRAGRGGAFMSLALDSGRYPHVSYATNGQVYYGHHNGSAWSNTLIASVASEATVHTSIAVDESDRVHMAYADDLGSGHLVYARLNGTAWETETIESSGVDGYPSIAIDSDGYPHITYQTASGLKHAWMQATSDLIVTDIWDDGGQIWYQVRNVGQGTAPAGHQVSLSVSGSPSGVNTIVSDLAPGERYTGAISTWSCSAPSDVLALTADWSGVVIESDETNNVRQETWNCDTTAPLITWWPTTTLVLTDSAVIEWGTNEVSDSRVYYDTAASGYSSSEYNPDNVTAHTVTLTGLTPGTVYRYSSESTDPSGNVVASGDYFFETAALPANLITGTMIIERSHNIYPSYDVIIQVDSPVSLASRAVVSEVDHVLLHVDDLLVGQAHTPSLVIGSKSEYHFTISPNRLKMSRDDYFVDPGDQAHRLEATIVSRDWNAVTVQDLFGPPREEIPVDVVLQTPLNNWIYYADEFGNLPPGTTIQISAEAIQYEWECEWISSQGSDPYSLSPECGDVAQQVPAVAFYVDGGLVHTSNGPTTDFVHVFEYDAEDLGVGTHIFQALALDADGEWRPSNAKTIIVEQGEPTLNVERTVTRNGNTYEVALAISLDTEAAGPAYLDYLLDYTDEFMPLQESSATYDVSFEYPAWLGTGERRARITIDFSSGGNDWVYLAPGNSLEITYQLVPILYEDGQANPRIGIPNVAVYYTYEDEYIHRTFDLAWQSLSSVQEALGSADYILVTNPQRLHDLYVKSQVHSLLGTMAHLATIRNGVLGFLDEYVGTYANSSDDMLRSLTEPGGYWAEALHPNFQDSLEGYMLIVGETEVVPAWDSHDFDICWDIPDDRWHCRVGDNDVYHHDQWYSNTAGNGKPELVVGRIIGNSAWQLERPLISSIKVHEGDFHYTAPGNALLVSGRGVGMSTFKLNVDGIEVILDDSDDPVEERWAVEVLDLPATDPEGVLHNAIIDGDFSLWHLMGHGNVDSFASALSTSNPPAFLGYRPFVFAPSCLTGNYEAGNDYNLAESLFDQGISTYIGSTQVSPISTNSEVSISFYKKWNWESGEALGRAFAQTERAYYDDWAYYDWYRFWVTEYNFYGDPKFGASGPAPLLRTVEAMTAAPTTTLSVQVPAYVVTTTVDGFDQVEIPNGMMFMEEGMHEIPYWTVSVPYAPTYRVQDVTLDVRAGYAFTTGLGLPTAVMTYYTSAPASGGYTQALSPTEDDDWFPALNQIYDWHVTQNPDGSSELEIQIFPFHYQPATTNVEWYDEFTFDIEVISTTVTIDDLKLDAGVYELGDPVTGDLWFSLTGDEQDLILAATVRNLVTGEVIDSLPVDALHNVTGPSHYDFAWDSTGTAPGQYQVWIDLLDSDGQLLDSASEMFRLGITSAEVTAFSATPGLFQPGDLIDISMTVINNGSTAVSGEMVVNVYATGASTPTATFTQAVTDLSASDTVVFNDVWDTTGVVEEEYRIIGYMKYAARTTEIEMVNVSTRARIYLPLVLVKGP